MVKRANTYITASTDGDRDEKAKAYVDAVAASTAKLLKTTLTDDFNDMASQVTDKLVTDYVTTDKYNKDAVTNNNMRAAYLNSHTNRHHRLLRLQVKN